MSCREERKNNSVEGARSCRQRSDPRYGVSQGIAQNCDSFRDKVWARLIEVSLTQGTQYQERISFRAALSDATSAGR